VEHDKELARLGGWIAKLEKKINRGVKVIQERRERERNGGH